MLATLAISGYRSLRELVLPLGRLNLVIGANGTGKSNLYRACVSIALGKRFDETILLAGDDRTRPAWQWPVR